MTISELLFRKCGEKFKIYKIPLMVSLVSALAAYAFMFTNKLVSWDDVFFSFSKGATLESGRWGLEILSYILPDFSMPWLWGLLSVLLLALIVCRTVKLFQIRTPVFQALLAALMTTMPAWIATFGYMFTSSSYAISCYCAVEAAVAVHRGGKWRFVVGLCLMVFSLSIYQVPVAITAGFLLLLVLQAQLNNWETPKKSLGRGIRYVLFLAAACVVYLAVNAVLLYVFGKTMGHSGNLGVLELLKRGVTAYAAFAASIALGFYGVTCTMLSRIAHITCTVVVLVLLLFSCWKERKNKGRTALILLCTALLPMACYCIMLISGKDSMHTLMTYGFVSCYVLICIVAETLMKERRWSSRDLAVLLMAVVVLSNVYVANRSYLTLHMAYENAYAAYTSAAAQIQMTHGFDANTRVALIGNAESNPHLDAFLPSQSPIRPGPNDIVGISTNLLNIYSRERFVQYYIGFDVEFVTDEEEAALREDPRVQAMSVYPYEGYIQKIDDVIVVRMGK